MNPHNRNAAHLTGVVLDFDSLSPESLDLTALEQLQGVKWQFYSTTSAQEVAERIREAHIILVNKVPLTQAILQDQPQLKYIGVLATGMNNIDLDACDKLGICVRNVEGYGTASVAQHTLMLILTLACSAHRYFADVRDERWSASKQFCLLDHPVMELEGKHLVIVGYGELGQAVAKLAKAFGMRVSVAQRPGTERAAHQVNDVSRLPLDELLPEADVISLHCLLSDQTALLINRERLAKLKPNAFIVNTARGGLIDENALLQALQSNQLGGAALDVLSQEPPPKHHVLLNTGLPNLIITPHTAWAAQQARQRLLNIAVEHLQQFLGCELDQ
ncbi:D-2-hydroxyacid dehydrogenase [Alteromonas oceanisediminis]|uniref:D-2-hydroxyacid dehydrogenase n=1 Tax=Alteromonas oceanisediminis TaxID=2836180 RepID=UPI001BDB594F|nr:D-2-hydroxyacid dehydrogenase [Alteromonas oceanisediminis]MBT0587899.1 D-2-hydroxyacid dehydrogenase [Alteromonas oceanisediminis]